MDFRQKVKQVSDDVGSSIGKMAKGLADSSKRVAERSKIKRNINSCENKLEAAYIEIGMKFVKKHFEQPEAQWDPDYKDSIHTVIDTQQEIEALQAQLAALENSSICSNCGKSVRNEQKFCSACGALNPNYREESEEEAVVPAEEPAPEETSEPAKSVEPVEAEIVEKS